MTYSLADIIRERRTRVPALAIRSVPLKFERELLAILLRIVNAPTPEEAQRASEEAIAWLSALGLWTDRQWRGAILRQTGIDLAGISRNMAHDPLVASSADWLLALISDLQQETASRLKTAQIVAEATKQPIRDIVRATISRQKRRAQLIAHDQAQKLAAKLNEAQQRDAGVTKYKWNHSFLPNARRHHVERQGNIYSWDRPPRGGHPGTEINCRCTAAAVVG